MRKVVGAMTMVAVLMAMTLSAAQDLTGKWTMKVSGGPHGDAAMGLVLKQDKEKVTASFDSGHAEPIEMTGTMVKGVLTLSSPENGEMSAITMKATLKEDGTLSGHVSSVMGDMTWTATRDKDRP